jgi:glucosamine--fructose-6-phosphate aminotransferase (isomerizing)
MNLHEKRYSKYALCNEMLETVNIIANFDPSKSREFVSLLKGRKKIFLTGEGSSRIFPAKHFIYRSLSLGTDYEVITEGAEQALEYILDCFVVFGVSNSGKTKEVMQLFSKLKQNQHHAFFGITATPGSPVATVPINSVVLSCGNETAVAATKSVVEQTLFFESLIYNYLNMKMPDLKTLAVNINDTLQRSIDEKIIKSLANAPIIYFAGRNDGVAEELTLKTNEITRKKSVFLEGTYALHGIEEVMNKGEVMIVIEPFKQEEEKFHKVLVEGTGIEVIAISSRDTIFPTIRIPDAGTYKNYTELAAGWNILTEVGISMGIDIDKPIRARKIGNENNAIAS